jgi:adenylylsulfate kinase
MIDTMDRAGARSKQASGLVVWVTGRPQSGKSTFARSLVERLRKRGCCALVLDGDALRPLLASGEGHDASARERFYARLADLAHLLASDALVVVVAATAQARRFRDRARQLAPRRFVEVLVDAPPSVCRSRDTKGLYALFDAGRAPTLPGMGVAYEEPMDPEVRATGGFDERALEEAAERCVARIDAATAS